MGRVWAFDTSKSSNPSWRFRRSPSNPPSPIISIADLSSRARCSARRYGRNFLFAMFFIILTTMLNSNFSAMPWHRKTTGDFSASYTTSSTTNSFVDFEHYGPKCNISSQDLYQRTGALCTERQDLLRALTEGGRIGKDAPYIPRGCDYKWYSTKEACAILGRFSQVVLVGDSMLRHVIGAMNIIIRQDLGYGGVTNWNFDANERQRCFCNRQFDVHHCSVQGIFSTVDVVKNDPSSLQCSQLQSKWDTTLSIEQMVRWPMPEIELRRLQDRVDVSQAGPRAFILGHGLWNDLKPNECLAWLDTVLDIIRPSLDGSTSRWQVNRAQMPILFITPNAAGELKPDEWLVSQGNKALVRFEKTMALEAAKRRIDHLGTWNMSIQASLYDGVHMDMRGNLVKAMMVLNWLEAL